MTTRPALATAVLIGFLSIPTAPLTEETVSTLTLDGLTFIPFGDQEILPIPSGAKIRVTTDETSPRSARFEQRLRLIGIAHGGLSMVIDAYGQRERVLPHDEYAHARVEVRPEPAPDEVETAALLMLPLLPGGGVMWGLGRWSRRSRGVLDERTPVA